MPWDILFFGLGIAAITFARRWKCPDSWAGSRIAGWGAAFFIVYTILKYGQYVAVP